MKFRITLSEIAVRQLRKLEKGDRDRIVRALRVLEEDPSRAHPKADVKILEGTEPRKYRIRIGEYRAVYAVAGSEVKIVEVFTRGREYG